MQSNSPPDQHLSPNWGFLYMGKYLQNNLKDVNQWYVANCGEENLRQLDATDRVQNVPNLEYVKDLKASAIRLKVTFESLFRILQHDMPIAMGATDQEAHKHGIKMVAANIIRCCLEMRQWEQCNMYMKPDSERLRKCRGQLNGFTIASVEQLNRLADHLVITFSQENPPKAVFFEMTFEPTKSMEDVYTLMDSFIENPEVPESPNKGQGSGLLRAMGLLWVMDALWPIRSDK
ncbi:MAG: hypothetical protein JKX84_11455 [Flavobacteriales bacterium]|nr:hypothetical protein [Flavobacteriales bacterium]